MPVAVPPAREIARTVADDRVGGQRLAHCLDYRAEVERSHTGRYLKPMLQAGKVAAE